MAKAPAFQFYVKDWMADLAEHPLEIEGAWCRFCAKAWLSETPGELWYTLDQWARLWRVDAEDALRIWRYIVEEKIGDSDTDITDFSRDSHEKIHLACRRMVREEKDKEGDRIRQRRRYEKKKGEPVPHADSHAGSHEKITSPSSSASATAKKEESTTPLPPVAPLPAQPVPTPEEKPLPGLDPYSLEFLEFWEAYPNKEAQDDAWIAWLELKKARKLPGLAVLQDAICLQEQGERWQDPKYIPSPGAWLRKGRWKDRPLPAAPRDGPKRPRSFREADMQRRDKRAEELNQRLFGGGLQDETAIDHGARTGRADGAQLPAGSESAFDGLGNYHGGRDSPG